MGEVRQKKLKKKVDKQINRMYTAGVNGDEDEALTPDEAAHIGRPTLKKKIKKGLTT